MFLGDIFAAIYRGMGDTRTPLKVMLLANAVHIAGDFLLIFGYLGFPRLGLTGAGIALAAANLISVFAYALLLHRSALFSSLWGPHLRFSLEWSRRILKIGIPGAFMALLRVTSLMGFTAILSRTPERMAAVAALPIGLTAESIAFMPGLGYSVAASALVGQALGAGDPKRAERYGWSATWQGVTIMTFMGVVFFIAADPFVRLFTSDPDVHRLAVTYLRIMAFAEPFLGLGMVLTGALQGAGDSLRPAILTALTFWVVRMPLAYALTVLVGLQTLGAWYAMAITTVIGGVLCIALFKSDSWKRVEV
jgi:putative MATE family efflux protein